MESKLENIDKKNNEFQTKILQSMFKILERLQSVEQIVDEVKKKNSKLQKNMFGDMLMNPNDDEQSEEEGSDEGEEEEDEEEDDGNEEGGNDGEDEVANR